MSYSDYSFYTSKYFGSLISESEYAKYSDRACDKLDFVTCENITADVLAVDKLSVKIKKAECAVAETLFKLEKADETSGVGTDGKGKIIKSESSGSVSQSYEVGKTLTEKLVSTSADIDRVIYDTVRTYLAGTGLLYAGL